MDRALRGERTREFRAFGRIGARAGVPGRLGRRPSPRTPNPDLMPLVGRAPAPRSGNPRDGRPVRADGWIGGGDFRPVLVGSASIPRRVRVGYRHRATIASRRLVGQGCATASSRTDSRVNSSIVQNIAWAASREELPEPCRRVLVELARAAVARQTFVIPLQDLARLALVSRTAASAHLAELTRAGLLADLESVGGMVVRGRLAFAPERSDALPEAPLHR